MSRFSSPTAFADPEDSPLVADAKRAPVDPVEYAYTEVRARVHQFSVPPAAAADADSHRDVILYNLGLGASEKELRWTYEGDDEFGALPTFGVVPQFAASSGLPLDWLPNFNPVSKAAAVTIVVETRDKKTGEVVFENQSTVFIRGAGGFGGKRVGSDRGAATAVNAPPKRSPDAVVEEKTVPSQAVLYRLSGDYNPLHILPEFAAVGGFDQPILHGLCSMGIAGKHVLKTFGPYEDIKVRFAGVVYPGETIVTEMWKEEGKVVFVAKVKERGTTVLAAAAATLVNGKAKL
ncbi:hypothetical protein C0992_005833 [Termitomyces sp. T32_za158]|nr:hypothetical protein C0992_005833 [Termitomyces sp. T32_za158]